MNTENKQAAQNTTTDTSELNKQHALQMPGYPVGFKHLSSGGLCQGRFGQGHVGFAAVRMNPGPQQMHLDLGHIFYSNPTEEDLLEAATTPWKEHADSMAASNINRRLSLIQAQFLASEICKFLDDKFEGVIPSDEEIKALRISPMQKRINVLAQGAKDLAEKRAKYPEDFNGQNGTPRVIRTLDGIAAADKILTDIDASFSENQLNASGELGIIDKEQFAGLKSLVSRLKTED